MILGTLLVLLTWIVGLAAVVLLGMAVTKIVSPSSRFAQIGLPQIRTSIWWGLALSIIAILITNLWLPLSSASAAAIFGAMIVVAAVLIVVRKSPIVIPSSRPQSWGFFILFIALASAIFYLAFSALGPVTNYDSGLYHLGAIHYSSEYATISGLANLYFPLGYNTSLYPFAAFLGNGPWGIEGYRLANGFITALVISDVVLRLLGARNSLRKLSVGSWVLVSGTLVGLVPLVALSDYWVTSPSSDAPVMMLTFVASAYLADGIFQAKNCKRNLATSFIVSVILFSLRPTMAVFLTAVALVVLVKLVRQQRANRKLRNIPLLMTAGALGIVMLMAQTVRDYFLSGWFQYPLSFYSFDTPWTAIDPTWNRTATLGNARNPADIWGSVDGFSWISAWIGRLPSQWETYLLIALALAFVTLLAIAQRSGAKIRWRALALASFPSAVASLTWFFFSPPSFRFGWGPLFSLLVIPLGAVLFALTQKFEPKFPLNSQHFRLIPVASLALLSCGLVIVTIYSATVRMPSLLDSQPAQWSLGAIDLTYQVTPVVDVPVTTKELTSGLVVTVPVESDQCWSNFSLCTPIVSESVRLRGESIQQGFLP